MARAENHPPAWFVALVQRLEKQARLNPAGYRARMNFLVYLGYGYLVFVFLLSLLLLAVVVGAIVFFVTNIHHVLAMKGLIYLIGGLGAVLVFVVILLFTLFSLLIHLFWYRFPPPSGLQLTRTAAPQLFKLIDKLQAEINTPRIHRILLDTDFNAGVVQIPRHGLLGAHDSYLIFGLPLMQALSPEQFQAVLAHELGHVSTNHGRFSLKVQHAWFTWITLLEMLEESEARGVEVMLWFFRWYAPRFHAYSFALRRAAEYEADRYAKKIAGSRAAAEALLSISIKARYLHNVFYPGVQQQLQVNPQGEFAIFTTLRHAFVEEIRQEDAAKWLAEELQLPTGYDDTHPCLAERVKCFSYNSGGDMDEPYSGRGPLPPPPPVAETAAEHYLGEFEVKAAKYLDNLYRGAFAVLQTHYRH